MPPPLDLRVTSCGVWLEVSLSPAAWARLGPLITTTTTPVLLEPSRNDSDVMGLQLSLNTSLLIKLLEAWRLMLKATNEATVTSTTTRSCVGGNPASAIPALDSSIVRTCHQTTMRRARPIRPTRRKRSKERSPSPPVCCNIGPTAEYACVDFLERASCRSLPSGARAISDAIMWGGA